jgi:predicted nucleic acid-binding protein
MARATVIDGGKHPFQASDRLLPDTNFWLLTHAPSSPVTNKQTRGYSNLFKTLLSAKSQLFLHPVVLGEYLHTYCRLEWTNSYPQNKLDKAARNSADYRDITYDAAQSAKNILRYCQLIGTGFAHTPQSSESFLNQFATGGVDWNDLLIAQDCQHLGLWLLTDDADHLASGLTVVTLNPKMLKP